MASTTSKIKKVKPIGGVHGVSAVFPTFKDIIDYEEQKVILNRGYPRFVTHPFVRKTEEYYKEKFLANEVLCCQSFEASLFLIIDYYLKKDAKIFTNHKLSKRYIHYFKRKFPNLIEEVNTPIKANIVLVKEEQFNKFKKNSKKTIIGIIEGGKEESKDLSGILDVLIFADKKNDLGILIFYNLDYMEVSLLRRHSGLIINSRKICKTQEKAKKQFKIYENNLRKKLGDLEKVDSNNCILFPSGMSAVFCTIFSLISPKKSKFIALGNLYVDTLKILEKWPKKYGLNHNAFIFHDFEMELVKKIDDSIAGIIFEIPSNPLIQLIEIEKIVSIAHAKNIKIILDNTIATPYNFNPFDYGIDIVVHSTTKFLNGKNNHLGGAILAKDRRIINEIMKFKNLLNLNISFDDIKVLSRNIKDFEKRMKIINHNTLSIANFLQKHVKIDRVYYPLLETNPNYSLAKKYLKGGSGVLSFILKNSSKNVAETFYDNIGPPILKGPSLGSEKTLLSPYVLMAHYKDNREYLKEMGLDFYLMRLSVGIEPIEKLIESLEFALNSINF